MNANTTFVGGLHECGLWSHHTYLRSTTPVDPPTAARVMGAGSRPTFVRKLTDVHDLWPNEHLPVWEVIVIPECMRSFPRRPSREQLERAFIGARRLGRSEFEERRPDHKSTTMGIVSIFGNIPRVIDDTTDPERYTLTVGSKWAMYILPTLASLIGAIVDEETPGVFNVARAKVRIEHKPECGPGTRYFWFLNELGQPVLLCHDCLGERVVHVHPYAKVLEPAVEKLEEAEEEPAHVTHGAIIVLGYHSPAEGGTFP